MKLHWKSDATGLGMIAASLAVIAVIVVVMSGHLTKKAEDDVRIQGVGLLRVLAKVPLHELAPQGQTARLLDVVRYSQASPSFAYAAVVTPDGAPLADVANPGILIPPGELPTEPSAWVGEREIPGGEGRRTILEFHAPLLEEGNLVGYLRLGYLKPEFAIGSQEIPFLASMALPIFLLTPAFYFLVKREIKPLRDVTAAMENAMNSRNEPAPVQIAATGELSEFIAHFNQFMVRSQNRIRDMESNEVGLLTSVKLLSYKQQRIDALLKSLPEAVLILDETGVVNFLNDKVGPLLGVDDEDILGKLPELWCEQPELRAFLERYSRPGMAGTAMQSIEFLPPHHPQAVMGISAYPLFSPKQVDRMLGTLVIFRDITEEKLIKQSRAEFVAQVAHEIKTPLNTLAMYSETLMDNEQLDETMRVEAVNVIRDETERLAGLIGNLLSITQLEMNGLKPDLQRVRVLEFIEDIYRNLATTARNKGIEFKLEVPREMSAVYLDKDLLRIAVNNLITNAIKYNRPNGSVVLSAHEDEHSIVIGVRDSGYGVAPEDQERIFDKFYRSERDEIRQQSGHGLGLPLARQIVQLHYGDLVLRSNLGQGSEFEIKLDKELISIKPVQATASPVDRAA